MGIPGRVTVTTVRKQGEQSVPVRTAERGSEGTAVFRVPSRLQQVFSSVSTAVVTSPVARKDQGVSVLPSGSRGRTRMALGVL